MEDFLALIKSTGGILKVKHKYAKMYISGTWHFGESVKTENENKEWFYLLDNGESYKEDQLIIGKENIREYKIKKIQEYLVKLKTKEYICNIYRRKKIIKMKSILTSRSLSRSSENIRGVIDMHT